MRFSPRRGESPIQQNAALTWTNGASRGRSSLRGDRGGLSLYASGTCQHMARNRRASDEQRLSSTEREEAPQPQPEHDEPRLREPTPTELSLRDYRAIVVRAGKEALDDHITNLAAAIAYYSFLAIPSLLLVAVGVFSLFASPDAIGTITEKLAGRRPARGADSDRRQPEASYRKQREFRDRDGSRRVRCSQSGR